MSILNSVWGLVFILILGFIVLVKAPSGAADTGTVIKSAAGGLGQIIAQLQGNTASAGSYSA